MATKIISVHATCKTLKEAKKIAKEAVKEGLAACANVHKVDSFYSWEGKMENHGEWEISFKTTDGAFLDLERKIRQLSGYEMPAIIALPIEHAGKEYEKWVRESVKLRFAGYG
ncbi:MAG: divalent-cation tolerance protein CutA [Candidatus Micrarchaeota archaeon]